MPAWRSIPDRALPRTHFFDFLMFTDNDVEPKKLNITRSIAGTHHAGERATRLVVPDRSIAYSDNIIAKEEHVTVIKKYPIITAKNNKYSNLLSS